jgi:uncharacterized RDD family membrane protein YckC
MSTTPPLFDYSSISRRVLAFFLDTLVLFIPCVIASHVIPIIGGLITIFIYAPILESSKLQATLGKYWAGIQVIDTSGKRISLQSALIRTLVKLISSIFCFIGHFFAFFNEKQQAFHDMIADTVVIYGRNENISVVDAWVYGIKNMFGSQIFKKNPSEFISELEKLQNLREKGVLTEDEFQNQKRKILEG